MKLIVGLGNPGEQYQNTRHNIGFMVVDELAKTYNQTDWKLEDKFKAEFLKIGEVILLKPQTFMNLSGFAVSAVMEYYKISVVDLMVVQDDLDMEFGRLKFAQNSSDGGHNGIKSVTGQLGTKAYKRLKIGISNVKGSTSKHVLSDFSKEECEKLPDLIKLSAEGVKFYIDTEDFSKTMASYNKK